MIGGPTRRLDTVEVGTGSHDRIAGTCAAGTRPGVLHVVLDARVRSGTDLTDALDDETIDSHLADARREALDPVRRM